MLIMFTFYILFQVVLLLGNILQLSIIFSYNYYYEVHKLQMTMQQVHVCPYLVVPPMPFGP